MLFCLIHSFCLVCNSSEPTSKLNNLYAATHRKWEELIAPWEASSSRRRRSCQVLSTHICVAPLPLQQPWRGWHKKLDVPSRSERAQGPREEKSLLSGNDWHYSMGVSFISCGKIHQRFSYFSLLKCVGVESKEGLKEVKLPKAPQITH